MKNPVSSLRGLSRRSFLKTSSAALGAAGLASLCELSETGGAESSSSSADGLIGKGDVILFQGDSITDAGRNRDKAAVPNQLAGMGTGYAWLAAVDLLVARPQ